jgi:hypothetical protein
LQRIKKFRQFRKPRRARNINLRLLGAIANLTRCHIGELTGVQMVSSRSLSSSLQVFIILSRFLLLVGL